MGFSQVNREAEVFTPLGSDVLLLQHMHFTEELGRMFNLRLDLLSENPDISFEDILAQTVSVRLDVQDEDKRYFHGYVTEFVQEPNQGPFAVYRAVVRPWLWFLTRTSDCRIFQDMTVPDIIKQVFRDASFTDFEDRLTADYRTWDYCVQYRETDFNFVSRLMEQEGIYYYFTHEKDKHTLVLADAYGSHDPLPGYAEIPYHQQTEGAGDDREYIFRWSVSKQVEPGIYALNDFDFERPNARMDVNSSLIQSHDMADNEVYDYPGEYVDTGDGENYARVRIQELAAQYERIQGAGNAKGMMSGGLFTLEDYPRRDQNREYLVVSVEHRMSDDRYFSTSGEAHASYSNSFTLVNSDLNFRAARITPKPLVQGPQTAIVVGPSGEEIHTDEHGRVKLQFHWDRYGKSDENSSCWVRVAQVWAGNNWGGIHIPRIGQEVIVEFLEGDPDRPIVTGRVYNGEQVPPYDLPANKTQSGIKSRSSKGGSSSNFNEIRMEDKKGEEQLYIHAEKNQDNVVENDETTSVGHDRTEDVGNDENITIGNNRTESVGGNEDIHISGNRTEKVDGNEDITIGINRTESVTVNESVDIGVNRSVKVGAIDNLDVGAVQNIKIGAAKNETIGAIYNLNVGAAMMLNVGASFTVVSPMGTRFVDNWLDKMGGTIFENYGTSIGATPLKMEATGVAMETKGVAMGMGRISLSHTHLNISKTTLDGSQSSIKLKDSGLEVTKDEFAIFL